MGNGHLVIIGGAEDREEDKQILNRFVALSGGNQARIVIITSASSHQAEMQEVYEKAFTACGVQSLRTLKIDQREAAGLPEHVRAISEASGIFMTGGEQNRLMSILGGTDAARAMHRAFRDRQACIAGTSAGASAISEHMIIHGRLGIRPEKDMLFIGAGLGFLKRVLIDQHFSERNRQSRLLSAVAQNPYLLGIGVDEDTALVVEDRGGIEVVGAGSVTLLDGRGMSYNNAVQAQEGELLAISNVRLHLLPTGFSYDLGDAETDTPALAAIRELVEIIAGMPVSHAEAA